MSLEWLSPSAVAVSGCHQAAFSQLFRALQSHPMAHSVSPYGTSNESAFVRESDKNPSKMQF